MRTKSEAVRPIEALRAGVGGIHRHVERGDRAAPAFGCSGHQQRTDAARCAGSTMMESNSAGRGRHRRKRRA